KEAQAAGAISLAGLAQSIFDAIDYQCEHQLQFGADREWLLEMKALTAETRKAIETGAEPSQDLLDIPLGYWRHFDSLDPVGIAASLNRPMLFLQGWRDFQVTVAVDLKLWRRGLAHRHDVTFKEFRKLNHLFLEQGTGVCRPVEYFTVPANVPPYV